ncbi:MAG TPA: GntR family transcriptional regulator [Chloroflexi bacterium]|nr:GntR family transcriptional regulator [Chloroflexota bacterium]
MSADETAPVPRYRQVAEQLAKEITEGALPADARIASERELAERFGISRMTARAAINILVRRGLITRRSGARAHVAPPKIRFDLSSPEGLYRQLEHAGIKPGARVITAEKLPCEALEPKICQALRLQDADEVYHVVRLRTADDEPITVENSYFPAALFPDLLDFHLTGSIYGILKKYFDVTPARAVQELEISLLDAEWAQIMGVPVDLPTLEIRRVAFTTEGVPFEYAYDIYRGDRILFTARTVTDNENTPPAWQPALDSLSGLG